jgi:hypothetical protein
MSLKKTLKIQMDEEAVKRNLKNKSIYLMFQDEARFGRMSEPRSCWASKGYRHIVKSALVREYKLFLGL